MESYSAEGVIVEDNVRLYPNASSIVKQFPFLLVSKWSEDPLAQVDGVIGLSRSFVTTDGQNSNSAFVESLFQSDQIDNKLFSVHFDSE